LSEPSEASGGLSGLSLTELEQAYVESVQAAEATEHVGRKNRLARHRDDIVQELKARGEARSVLQRLADHPDAEVRRWASGNLAWFDRPKAETLPQELPPRGMRWQMTWQPDNPPPASLRRDEIAHRLGDAVPEFGDRLIALARPAIALWPQRRNTIAATASRFGGMPLAPPDWQWPTVQEEPLLFVGQVNCAELRGLPGAELLPGSGLLAFFGDHDAVTGCFPFGDHCVFHWPDVGQLVPAKADLDPIEVFPSCAILPRPILDLPDPHSRKIRDLHLSHVQTSLYGEEWKALRYHGIPYGVQGYCGFAKLLGWPALVQPTHDLDRFEDHDDARLLLQVDRYCNGEELHGWGPGGSLYYVLPERDLRAQIFEGCELEGQFT
jgi:Domain of unknown function (DUF1963)